MSSGINSFGSANFGGTNDLITDIVREGITTEIKRSSGGAVGGATGPGAGGVGGGAGAGAGGGPEAASFGDSRAFGFGARPPGGARPFGGGRPFGGFRPFGGGFGPAQNAFSGINGGGGGGGGGVDVPSNEVFRALNFSESNTGGFEGFAGFMFAIKSASMNNQLQSIATEGKTGGGALADPLEAIQDIISSLEFTLEKK